VGKRRCPNPDQAFDSNPECERGKVRSEDERKCRLRDDNGGETSQSEIKDDFYMKGLEVLPNRGDKPEEKRVII